MVLAPRRTRGTGILCAAWQVILSERSNSAGERWGQR